MNTIIISGYVCKNPVKEEKSSRFQINVYAGKDRDGNPKNFYLSVKTIGPVNIKENEYVLVSGWLDIYKYNDKYYTSVIANAKDIFKQERTRGNSIYEDSNSIPF